MERKLVSIQRIDALAPIPGADQILQARVMGWTVVVRTGEFAVGDPCVFFEIDSVLPDGATWAEFMRPRGFRIRTLRLRGVLSQGLALPLSAFPVESAFEHWENGDLRDRLGVTKFELEPPDSREIAGPFPARVPKTDEIRLQSALGVLDEIRGQEFYVSSKCDGISATFLQDEDGLVAASRTATLTRDARYVWEIADRHRLADQIPQGVAIQGELCGPGIRKNRLGLTEVDLLVFNVYDVRAARILPLDAMLAFCAERGLATVPIERVVRGDQAAHFKHTLEGWIEAARGYYANTRQRKEGIVVRSLVERFSATLNHRLSWKVLNNDFLLKEED
jgi:RNA ligase (TIGR02306 family)